MIAVIFGLLILGYQLLEVSTPRRNEPQLGRLWCVSCIGACITWVGVFQTWGFSLSIVIWLITLPLRAYTLLGYGIYWPQLIFVTALTFWMVCLNSYPKLRMTLLSLVVGMGLGGLTVSSLEMQVSFIADRQAVLSGLTRWDSVRVLDSIRGTTYFHATGTDGTARYHWSYQNMDWVQRD